MFKNFTFSVPIESPASFGLRKNRIKAQGLSKSDGLHAIAALAGISPIFANRVSKSVRKLFGILDDSAWRYPIGLHPPGGSHIKTYFARQHSDSPAGLSDTLIVACRAASPKTPQKLNKLPVRPDVVTLWRHLAAPGLGGAPEGRSLMTNDNVLMGNHYQLCIEDKVSQRRIARRLQMASTANVCQVLPRANEKKNRETLLHFVDSSKVR